MGSCYFLLIFPREEGGYFPHFASIRTMFTRHKRSHKTWKLTQMDTKDTKIKQEAMHFPNIYYAFQVYWYNLGVGITRKILSIYGEFRPIDLSRSSTRMNCILRTVWQDNALWKGNRCSLVWSVFEYSLKCILLKIKLETSQLYVNWIYAHRYLHPTNFYLRILRRNLYLVVCLDNLIRL